MPDFDWKKLVGSVAPTIATALGGPLAGVATSAISTALLGKTDGKESEIVQALQTGGADALLKLKQADQDFAVKMREMDIDIEKINAADRDSARKREISLGDWTPRVLAFIFVIGFFVAQYIVFTSGVPDANRELIARVLGTLDASLVMILTYYFGSSAGSAKKNETIGKMLSQ